MKIFTSKTQKVGELGENVAVKYLIAKGFSLLDRNYTKKCGEIDIIAQKTGITHFVEVKSVSCEITGKLDRFYRPEDNMNRAKISRLRRTIRACLLDLENRGFEERELEWQFDLICVYLDMVKRQARVRFMGNIIL